jgi:hypothetical protein
MLSRNLVRILGNFYEMTSQDMRLAPVAVGSRLGFQFRRHSSVKFICPDCRIGSENETCPQCRAFIGHYCLGLRDTNHFQVLVGAVGVIVLAFVLFGTNDTNSTEKERVQPQSITIRLSASPATDVGSDGRARISAAGDSSSSPSVTVYLYQKGSERSVRDHSAMSSLR